jgi:hypothetical protein
MQGYSGSMLHQGHACAWTCTSCGCCSCWRYEPHAAGAYRGRLQLPLDSPDMDLTVDGPLTT